MKNNKIKIVTLVTISLFLALALIPMAASAASKPTVSFSISPTSLKIGESFTMTWSSTNANKVYITGKSGSYTYGPHEVALSGTQKILASSTDLVGKPYIMTIDATGPGGNATKSITISVSAATKPTVTLTAIPTSIYAGAYCALKWSSSNAYKVTINNGINTGGKQTGVADIPPLLKTTTFTATATSNYSSSTATATVTVTTIKPTAKITAPYTTIKSGSSVTLTCSYRYANDVTESRPNEWWDPFGWFNSGRIGGGHSTYIKTDTDTYYITVKPTSTTTYTLTATGPGGTAKSSVTITVK